LEKARRKHECNPDTATSTAKMIGDSLAENVLKCQLEPPDPVDSLPVLLTAARLDPLRAVFPDGVCDWSTPGMGQGPAISLLDFTAGPGGTLLPPGRRSRRRSDFLKAWGREAVSSRAR
jgi:hypothetical protein